MLMQTKFIKKQYQQNVHLCLKCVFDDGYK